VGSLASAYADNNIAVLCFVLMTILWIYFNQKVAQKPLAFAAGLIMGILTITKADSSYRMILCLLPFSYYLWHLKSHRKNLLWSLLPLLFIHGLELSSRPNLPITKQFFDEIVLSPSFILHRIPDALHSFYYALSIPYDGILKSGWIINFLLGILSVYILLREKKYILLLVLALPIVSIFIFNMLPILIVNNTIDPSLNDPKFYAEMGFIRFNLTIALHLNALCLLGLYYGNFWGICKEILNCLRLSTFNSQFKDRP
jgi:hypothetical protein